MIGVTQVADIQVLSSPSSQAPDRAREPAPGLADEHDQLLRQVAIRTEALLAVATAGHWPARELEALLRYLRAEILRQAADEEKLLFPAHRARPELTRLARDHTRLRAGVEALERAACQAGVSPAWLATWTRDLLCQLESHLDAEEAILAAPRPRPILSPDSSAARYRSGAMVAAQRDRGPVVLDG